MYISGWWASICYRSMPQYNVLHKRDLISVTNICNNNKNYKNMKRKYGIIGSALFLMSSIIICRSVFTLLCTLDLEWVRVFLFTALNDFDPYWANDTIFNKDTYSVRYKMSREKNTQQDTTHFFKNYFFRFVSIVSISLRSYTRRFLAECFDV